MLINKPGRILFILVLLLLQICSASSQIRVGLLLSQKPHSVLFHVRNGTYQIIINNSVTALMEKGDFALISRAGDKLAFSYANENAVLIDSVVFNPLNDDDFFSVRDNLKEAKVNNYDGGLTVKNDLGSLLLINRLSMEKYICGVVQAEGGYKGHIEYYKTQAVIARSYASMYLNKHQPDGYNVCDNTHCQAYHGRSVSKKINEAVRMTLGLVITDSDSLLALTPFHSNCGGETESSGNVWLTSVPHLTKVTDPYCNYSRNASWTMDIAMNEWISYLREHGFEGSEDEISVFTQYTRTSDYTVGDFSYPLNKVRIDWNLRSTFFSLKPEADKVVLTGRGYGHGVGLCQEGAMVMAKRGFRMKQIIDFYYKGVEILDLEDVKPAEMINSTF